MLALIVVTPIVLEFRFRARAVGGALDDVPLVLATLGLEPT